MQAIKLDVAITPSGDLRRDLAQIKRAEQLGFDAVWVWERAHNPFFPLTLAAKETHAISLGTSGALAFPRSPMTTAQIAWDLARQSAGRFALGLSAGAAESDSPAVSDEMTDLVGRMREYIESLRAIWDTFQTGARLRYRGRHYQFRLMAPFFNPGPIPHPGIPVHLAGPTSEFCQLAGEACGGLHLNALQTPACLREVVLPAMRAGLGASGRSRSEIVVTAQAVVISGASERERHHAETAVRARLAYLASKPENQRILDWQGLGSLADELGGLARENRWADMPAAIPGDLLRQTALIAEPDEVYAKLLERYGGIADRVCLEWTAGRPAICEAIARSRLRSA